jgi:PAS domain S-box-containing protein
MQTLNGEPVSFPAISPSGSRERKKVQLSLLASLAFFLCLANFAKVQLAKVEAFLPVCQTALIVIELITAVLLFGQFRIQRARSLLILTGGYLFSAAMAVVHLLSFPNLFGLAGLAGVGQQTAAWLYFLWHGGFSAFIIGYARLRSSKHDALSEGSAIVYNLCTVTVTVAVLVIGFALLTTKGHDLLPVIMRGNLDAPAKFFVALATWLLNFAALLTLCSGRPQTVLDLWLMWVVCAWLFDTALASVLNHGRYDVGWYAGRIYGLAAAGYVLVQLLLEQSRWYTQLARLHDRRIAENAHRLDLADRRLALAQRTVATGFWDWDLASGKVTWSSELFRLFGLDAAAAVASFETWRSIIHPEDLSGAKARIDEAVRTRQPLFSRYRVIHPGGEVRWIEALGESFHDGHGQGLRMSGICIDVTGRMRTEEALRESEARYRTLLRQAPDGIFVADADGRYQIVNEMGGQMLGYSHEEFLGMSFPDILAPEELSRFQDHLQLYRDTSIGHTISSEWCFRRKDGSVFVGEVMGRRLSDGRLQAILRDVTQRRQSERQLRLQAEILSRIGDGVNLVSCADGCIVYVNAAFEALFGYEAGELLGRTAAILDAADASLSEARARTIIDSLRAEGCWQGDVLNRRKDGSCFWSNASITTRDFPGWGAVWLSVQRDITPRKQFEAALAERDNLLRIISDNVEEHIWIMDRQHRIQFANPPMMDIERADGQFFGPDVCNLLGRTELEIFGDNSESRDLYQSNEKVMSTGLAAITEECIPTRRGLRNMLASRYPFRNGAGEVNGLVGVARDITERKEAETARLIAVERQRDTLVREVHHRIKNHLQGVIGLLRNAITVNPGVADPLEATIARIRTIAEVYGLQSHPGESQIRLNALTRKAIAGSDSTAVFEAVANTGEFPLLQEDTVLLALMINELVTNAGKHRVAPSSDRPVTVRLEEDAQGARIEIAGGPARLPQGFDYAKRQGFGTGLELVAALLPEKRMRLTYRQTGDKVVASLELRPASPLPPDAPIER